MRNKDSDLDIVDDDFDDEASEYGSRRRKIISEITKENAGELFCEAREKVLEKLETLDISKIEEIEEFYLIVLKYTQSYSFVWAKEKCDEKGISFEKAITGFCTDELMAFLIDDLKKDERRAYLNKLVRFEEKFNKYESPEWESNHSVMHTVSLELAKKGHVFDLNSFHENINKLKTESEKSKSEKGIQLANCLEKNIDDYLVKVNSKSFVEACRGNINSFSVLKTQSFLKQIIDDIANALVNLNPWQSQSKRFSLFFNPIRESIQGMEKNLEEGKENKI